MPSRLATVIDTALEKTVVGSYSRLGPGIRRRTDRWARLDNSLRGRLVVITGATSGIGRAAATECARLGAGVVLVGRDQQRTEAVAAELRRTGAAASIVVADMSDVEQVRRAAGQLSDRPIDALIHNAGTLAARRQMSPQGIEQTVATQLIGPLVLSYLCAPSLRAARGRIIVVTSGGMYTQPLDVGGLNPSDSEYKGVVAYARTKRAQVSLVERCAPRLASCGVGLAAMHPGWANTPGLQASLPGFHRLMRPLLRDPAAGADTIAWLAGLPVAELARGSLWLDRRPRNPHRRASTRRSDTASRRQALLDYCLGLSGLSQRELAVWDA